jgi:zinc transporter 9
MKVVVSAIAGNGVITVLKFGAWIVSASPSLLAEAIHSLADTFNQILLLVGMRQSIEERSTELPTGSGGARYLWNLISAVGIFFIGFGVTFYHGINSLMQGNYEVGPISWLVIIVLLISLAIELYVFIQAHKEVKLQKGSKSFYEFMNTSDDPTIVAVWLEDGVAVVGILFALSGVALGQIFQNALFDIIASIGISFLLGFMAVLLGVINSKLLIGKSADVTKVEEFKKFINSQPEVQNVVEISTKVLGANQVRLSVEVELIGEKIIDYQALEDDARKISEGNPVQKVLIKSSNRMVRLTGNTINKLELAIQEKFPEIIIIDFEVN